MALPIPIPALPLAAAVCLLPSGKIRPLPVVVIRMLPVTSSAVPDVTEAVLIPTLLVVTVIAPRVEALHTIVMLDAVTAPVTVRSPVTVAPVEVNATAPIVDAEPVAVISATVIVLALMLPLTVRLLAVTEPVTVRLPVTVAAVDVNATAPIVDALPVAVMSVTVIVSAEMLPLTVKVDAVTSVKLAFCANSANVPLVAGRVTVRLPL